MMKPSTPEEFFEQIKDAAAILNMPVNERRTKDCLTYFSNEFAYQSENHIFAYKIASKPKAELFYRVFSHCKNRRELLNNCYHLLADNCESHKMILSILLDTLVTQDWIFADFEISRGLEKIWFSTESNKLDLIVDSTRDYLPPAIVKWVPRFKELELENVAFLALDFHQKSVNVYFPVSRQLFSRKWCESIFEKAGWNKNLLHEETVEYLDSSVDQLTVNCIGFTFSKDNLERFCFYDIAIGRETIPRDLHPNLVDFYKRYHTFSSVPQAVIGRSYSSSPTGYYQKLDVNVLGDFTKFGDAIVKHTVPE